MHSFFLLLDEPEAYSLPPDPKVPTRDLDSIWGSAFAAAGALAAGIALSVIGARRR
jgi:formate dehydrogenase iron-sulfur subunit